MLFLKENYPLRILFMKTFKKEHKWHFLLSYIWKNLTWISTCNAFDHFAWILNYSGLLFWSLWYLTFGCWNWPMHSIGCWNWTMHSIGCWNWTMHSIGCWNWTMHSIGCWIWIIGFLFLYCSNFSMAWLIFWMHWYLTVPNFPPIFFIIPTPLFF